MRYAIVNNVRASASPGETGTCPACSKPVIAKCGDKRVHHWAHRGRRSCDQWWEARTPWHCAWQDRFPKEWQEFVKFAETGEKHIADVHTDLGLTVEVQHSPLRPEEIAARERFYRNMVWVVNGARVHRDLQRFLRWSRSAPTAWRMGVYLTSGPEQILPSAWVNCDAPVVFDFKGKWKLMDVTKPLVEPLWCLLPRGARKMAAIVCLPRASFVRRARERSRVLQAAAMIRRVEKLFGTHQKAESLARQFRAAPSQMTRPYPTDFALGRSHVRRTPRMP